MENETKEIDQKKMTIKEFFYRLFFTRNDDLDVLQILFSAVVVVTLIIVYNTTSNQSAEYFVREAFVTLRWLSGLLVITAVPSWLVPIVSSRWKRMDMFNSQTYTRSSSYQGIAGNSSQIEHIGPFIDTTLPDGEQPR